MRWGRQQCFNKQQGERNSNTCQRRLNTSDSCPPGKFGVRVRTGRVKDQVAATQTRQALSLSLQGACLTDRREKDTESKRERELQIEKKKGTRKRTGEHDRRKERKEKRWQGEQTSSVS